MVGKKPEAERILEVDVATEQAMKQLFQPVVVGAEKEQTTLKSEKKPPAEAAEQVLDQKTTFGTV